MTPREVWNHLYSLIDILGRLIPGFHTLEDRAALAQARAALEAVAARLGRDIAREDALVEEKTP
jgi:hypothetical protein